MKKINKVTKPVYTVDISSAETVYDVLTAFALVKFDNNVELTPREMDLVMIATLASSAVTLAKIYFNVNPKSEALLIYRDLNVASMRKPTEGEVGYVLNSIKPKAEKKPNIFKRFWNWITRKK